MNGWRRLRDKGQFMHAVFHGDRTAANAGAGARSDGGGTTTMRCDTALSRTRLAGFALAIPMLALLGTAAGAQNGFPSYGPGQQQGGPGGYQPSPYPQNGAMPGGAGGYGGQPAQYPGAGGYPPNGQMPPMAGGYPQQPGQYPPGGAGGYPPAGPAGGGGPNIDMARLEQMSQAERQDLRVPPTPELHTGAMHAPTPNQIPGGQVITTQGLVGLMGNQQVRAAIFDVLGGPQRLPNAIAAVAASQPGSFDDQMQQQFGQFLQGVTGGNRQTPLVFYCQGLHCWMSYNASLRAIRLGYSNVLWYRGGIEAWQQAGLPMQPQEQGGQPQQQPQNSYQQPGQYGGPQMQQPSYPPSGGQMGGPMMGGPMR
jgi:PQQ-dependent catabolism-associated CXXCW motif protein